MMDISSSYFCAAVTRFFLSLFLLLHRSPAMCVCARFFLFLSLNHQHVQAKQAVKLGNIEGKYTKPACECAKVKEVDRHTNKHTQREKTCEIVRPSGIERLNDTTER